MSFIHQINCAATRRNTGFGGCPVDWKEMAGAFIFDNPHSFSANDLATLQTTLQALANSDSKSGRMYPIGGFLNNTDNSEQPVIQTFSTGAKAKVRDGVNDWSFQFTAGGFCLLQAARTHNGNSSVWALFYDKEGKILGYNNNGHLAAIPLQIFDAEPWKMNTGTTVAVYMVHFVFDVTYSNDYGEYTKANFDLSTITGFQDVKIIVNGFNQSTGLANISIITECGGANLYANYSADFTTAAFTASNGDTGASIPITSITPIASNQTFNLQLNHGSANWPSDGNVLLQGAVPSALAALGIVGYEIEQVYLEVTSS